MNRRKWVVLAGLAGLAGVGCSPASLAWLFRGDGKVPPESPLPAKEGKSVVTVAILASADPAVSVDPAFAGVERELATLVGRYMTAATEKDRRPIKVVEVGKVQKARAKAGGGWQNPVAVGKEVGADYVIDVTLQAMSIYQAEYGQEFYQGRAKLGVVVYDMDKPGETYQDYEHSGFGEQKNTTTLSPSGYRKYFVESLARELTNRHVPHESGPRRPTQQ